MDLKSLKKLKEPKVYIAFSLYETTKRDLEKFCEKEKIRVNDLLRNIVNETLYKEKA